MKKNQAIYLALTVVFIALAFSVIALCMQGEMLMVACMTLLVVCGACYDWLR